MREILFRGKRIDNGEWVYGSLLISEHQEKNLEPLHYFICPLDKGYHRVIPETVGQHTGLKDKNGRKIFEGDIARDEDTEKIYEIAYHRHMFMRYERKPMYMFFTLDGDCLEVIGNIHDNPELLGGDSNV